MAHEQEGRTAGLSFREYLQILGWTVLAGLLLKSCVLDAYRIPTGSMEPVLLAGDFVLVNKILYGPQTPRTIPFTSVRVPSVRFPSLATPHAGDAIVFEFPGAIDPSQTPDPLVMVKRCIGTPGDTVSVVGGRVVVNGRELLLSRTMVGGSSDSTIGPVIIPRQGEEIPVDAATLPSVRLLIEREGHAVHVDGTGTVFIDGYPASRYRVQQNHYFVLGDNLDHSVDSRAWGLVPDQRIVGKVLVIYWSWDDEAARRGIRERIASVRWDRIGTLVR